MVGKGVDRHIVKSIHQIARELRAGTVAGFIENRESLSMVSAIGIDFARVLRSIDRNRLMAVWPFWRMRGFCRECVSMQKAALGRLRYCNYNNQTVRRSLAESLPDRRSV
ncbi:hypothetical protein [Microvirga sp. VF16]|uniref:hypothetical protein n=1 Tax=Microvirga sp. VF16 TaxID=2807101 RepID=UPI0035300534